MLAAQVSPEEPDNFDYGGASADDDGSGLDGDVGSLTARALMSYGRGRKPPRDAEIHAGQQGTRSMLPRNLLAETLPSLLAKPLHKQCATP